MATPSKSIGIKNSKMTYTERQAVRAVNFNALGQIALIHAEKEDYYKLPGGGIEPGEDHIVAVEREMKEETGALIKIRPIGCVATTEEYRGDLHQISYCYCADLVDDSGAPELTELEIEDRLVHRWVSVEEAKKQMEEAQPTSEFGRFIKERDIFLLGEVLKRTQLLN
ncbi:unnamed protein product [Clonostachys chloroleuca]|uniref:Nudix hydrolase domain-containing protein n=1 Tax=Clonostachys chloroleuca TaxID=1926264 RepID=A0AA35LQ37_9HYPO|nr:unnamed protein product [Clonostachys chloroleuca]